MDVDLVITESTDHASEAAAELLAAAARAGAAVALSGGSTPRQAHELAASAEPDWSRASVWLVDERVVPPDDPRSNARLVRETLLDRLTRPPDTHFVRTDLVPDDAAAAYDLELGEARIGLALLGIGHDGHTASLFPDAPALDEREQLAVAAEAQLEPFVPRVTMTIPALAAVEHLLFLVTGENKADAVRRAFAEPPSHATPASLVRSAAGTTTAVLDRGAARLLPQ
jgi:6-phosphogluconolactonase